MTIYLQNGRVAHCDAEDFEALTDEVWRCSRKVPYAVNEDGKPMHTIVVRRMGLPTGRPYRIKHVNRDVLDCRRANIYVIRPNSQSVNDYANQLQLAAWKEQQ